MTAKIEFTDTQNPDGTYRIEIQIDGSETEVKSLSEKIIAESIAIGISPDLLSIIKPHPVASTTDLLSHLIKDADLPDSIDVVGGYGIMTDGQTDTHFTLPAQYTSEQRQAFATGLGDGDLSIIASTLWLTDRGILEYVGENDDWTYCGVIPVMPAFPNTGALTDVVNNPQSMILLATNDVVAVSPQLSDLLDITPSDK